MLRRWLTAIALTALPVSAAVADDGNCQLTSSQVAKVQNTLLPVTQTPEASAGLLPEDLLHGLLILGALGGAFLFVLLCRAFRDRADAEANADSHLSRLIELKPEAFLPSVRS